MASCGLATMRPRRSRRRRRLNWTGCTSTSSAKGHASLGPERLGRPNVDVATTRVDHHAIVGARVLQRDLLIGHVLGHQLWVARERIAMAAGAGQRMAQYVARVQDAERLRGRIFRHAVARQEIGGWRAGLAASKAPRLKS